MLNALIGTVKPVFSCTIASEGKQLEDVEVDDDCALLRVPDEVHVPWLLPHELHVVEQMLEKDEESHFVAERQVAL